MALPFATRAHPRLRSRPSDRTRRLTRRPRDTAGEIPVPPLTRRAGRCLFLICHRPLSVPLGDGPDRCEGVRTVPARPTGRLREPQLLETELHPELESRPMQTMMSQTMGAGCSIGRWCRTVCCRRRGTRRHQRQSSGPDYGGAGRIYNPEFTCLFLMDSS